MNIILGIVDVSLPLDNPVLKFLVILVVILSTPILLNKLKIPHILGLIIAGAVIGPNGFNLLLRDSGIILSGTAGLLYIMFLAGLDIELTEFRKNRFKSVLFGMYTFLIPMLLGILAGLYVLKLPVPTTILLASMFASHTLIAYPILSKLGVTKNRAVNITVGGTIITDTLALLVLAVIVGMETGEANHLFWTRLSTALLAFGLFVIFVFPIIGRWFLKLYEDSVSQYIFVLAMVFLGAVLAEAAGVEAIIGAFLSGLALNRLIPSTSALMNRIKFVGNAIFIPFFLIGVGMLLDYRVFFQDTETIMVAVVMTVVATTAKFLAAWITQKTLRFTADERRIIFGLSNAQAAATLAAVIVGYNVITGQTPDGEPIRLLSESILNGTIIMILVTCTIATFVAQKGGQNLSLSGSAMMDKGDLEIPEKILIPVSHPDTIEELINLSTIIKSRDNFKDLFALHIIHNDSQDPEVVNEAKKLLEHAVVSASSTDIQLNKLLRYDLNIPNGITNVVREHNITDLVLGLDARKGISGNFWSSLTGGILMKNNITTIVYKPVQPISTIKRHLIMIPEHAESEIGFPFWLAKIWNIPRNTGARMIFHGSEKTLSLIREIHSNYPINADFRVFHNWQALLSLSGHLKPDDNLIVVMSRERKASYQHVMAEIPDYLNRHIKSVGYMMVYPMQSGVPDTKVIDLNNPSLLEPIEKLDEIGKTIMRLFKRK